MILGDFLMKDLFRAVLSGFIITVAVICYFSVEDKIIGAFLFNIALATILIFELNLYTGKIAYIVENDFKYIKRVLIILLGNIIGVISSCYLFTVTRYADKIIEKADALVEVKLNDNLLSIIVLAIFCGFLMYIAVEGFKKANHEIGKYLIFILCIMVFVMAGFEHSIADVAYLTFANAIWSLESLIFILIALAGNAVGAIIIPTLKKYNLF